MLTENISALDRFDALGVSPRDDDNADSGAEDVGRRIRTWMRPLTSISDSVQSGPRPSRDITSLSISNLVMEAAMEPGNWLRISIVAPLYSKRNSKKVYLHCSKYRNVTTDLHSLCNFFGAYCRYIYINSIIP